VCAGPRRHRGRHGHGAPRLAHLKKEVLSTRDWRFEERRGRPNWMKEAFQKGDRAISFGETLTSAPLSHLRHAPRRGLSRDEAAIYVGVSTGLFDQMVVDGRMPRARRINGRKVWDVREVDIAFDALPHEDGPRSSWEDA
jgi:hypothetical protein